MASQWVGRWAGRWNGQGGDGAAPTVVTAALTVAGSGTASFAAALRATAGLRAQGSGAGVFSAVLAVQPAPVEQPYAHCTASGGVLPSSSRWRQWKRRQKRRKQEEEVLLLQLNF